MLFDIVPNKHPAFNATRPNTCYICLDTMTRVRLIVKNSRGPPLVFGNVYRVLGASSC